MSDQEKLSENEKNLQKIDGQNEENTAAENNAEETHKDGLKETKEEVSESKLELNSDESEVKPEKDDASESEKTKESIEEKPSENAEDIKTKPEETEEASSEKISESETSEDDIPKEKTSEEKTSEEKTSEKNISKENTSEEIVSEEKIEETTKSEGLPETTEEPESNKNDEETDEDEISSSDDEEKDDDDDANQGKDYHSMTQKQLVAALKELLQSKKVQEIKKDVEEIKAEFNSHFEEELNEKKEEFLAQGGNIIDFHYSPALKSEFNSLYFEYKEKRNQYYKTLKNDLKANLAVRLELIEQLKGLISIEENINTTYKQFKEIQQKWREAGPIPRDGYNTVWNTYHHHVENFYDFLHLNREFRDMDFKHNLEQKLKIINRAEELATETDLNKAFRELQMLHKMWKEDTGPVAKEYRDDVWDKFSAATKVLHDKRLEHQKELEKDFEDNLEKKKQIIEQIKQLIENTKDSHQNWQNGIKNLEKLRQEFFSIGKVPAKNNEEIWSSFKEAVRNFNKKKNQFYKNQKKEQFSNLEKKKDLIRLAEEHMNSEDFETVTPLMKKIQSDWKKIGHVPRKDSDKVWKKFKAACNHYFDRLNKERDEANKEELEAFEKKSIMLEELAKLETTGDPKQDLETIKSKIAAWKEIGRVPFNKKHIEGKFNKSIDKLFKKLDMSKKEMELLKYDNKLDAISSHDDERKMQNERFFITKKIDEVKQEINQLENNLGFFQHVDDDNPLVKEVHKNIQRHKDELELWKAKLKKLKEVM